MPYNTKPDAKIPPYGDPTETEEAPLIRIAKRIANMAPDVLEKRLGKDVADKLAATLAKYSKQRTG